MHALFSALIASAALISARKVSFSLDVGNGYVSPDGFNRSAVTVNGITPGPVLTVDKGDEVLIRVNNHLSEASMLKSTTVHWHGILQHRTAYDDGVAFVTQCPIAQNNSYQYRFSTSGQAGTFWDVAMLVCWSRSQYIDGLRGPLVIYDHAGDDHRTLYDVDDRSTIISLADWYHISAETLRTDWMANRIPEPAPDSNLFNGIGRYKGGPELPRPVVDVEHGKRYRLRIINMSAVAIFNFTVEGHPITVIEADGINHHPLTVSVLTLAAGQRYSVILHANRKVANYWIAYPSNFRETVVPNVNPNYNGTEAFAVLRYKGAPNAEPETSNFAPNASNPLLEHQLRPLNSPPPPSDTPIVVNITYFPTDDGGAVDTPGGAKVWLVNNVQYKPPTVPTLLEILTHPSNTTSNTSLSGPGAGVYVLPSNRTIDVRLLGDEHHPFHLHGHTFQVLRSAEGAWNDVDPPIRDTVVSNNVSSTSTGPVTFRFRTNNPGPWLLHCHKNWHMEAGLALVFAESPNDIRTGPSAMKPSSQWNQLCNIYRSISDSEKQASGSNFTPGNPCQHPPCVAPDNAEKQEVIAHTFLPQRGDSHN